MSRDRGWAHLCPDGLPPGPAGGRHAGLAVLGAVQQHYECAIIFFPPHLLQHYLPRRAHLHHIPAALSSPLHHAGFGLAALRACAVGRQSQIRRVLLHSGTLPSIIHADEGGPAYYCMQQLRSQLQAMNACFHQHTLAIYVNDERMCKEVMHWLCSRAELRTAGWGRAG